MVKFRSALSPNVDVFKKVHLRMFLWLFLRWFTHVNLEVITIFFLRSSFGITTYLLFLQIYIFNEYWNMETLFVVSLNSHFSYQEIFIS